MSDVLKLKDYDTRRILELAFAAHRINNGYVKETRRYSEGQSTVWSNKEIVSFSAAYYDGGSQSSWVPTDFIPIKVTDADHAALAAADKHMRRYTMLVLGNLSDFQNNIFTAYAGDRVTSGQLGFIAYLPQFVERELEEKMYKSRLSTEFSNSSAIKEKKIIGELEILKRIYSPNYETFFYTAGFNRNLVMFSNKFQYKVGEVFGFKANIKNQYTDRDSGLTVNKLNYVKLVKMEN
tara:strand:+ start:2715 stop:3422 length:708 start_codon:yes stop_codon:yes gene_type:complete